MVAGLGPSDGQVGITPKVLAVSGKIPYGPAGGAPEGYGLGRGAAAAHQCRPKTLRVTVQGGNIQLSAGALPPVTTKDRIDWRT